MASGSLVPFQARRPCRSIGIGREITREGHPPHCFKDLRVSFNSALTLTPYPPFEELRAVGRGGAERGGAQVGY